MSIEDEPSQFRNYYHIFHIVHNFAPSHDRSAGICIFVNKTENILIQKNLLEGRLIYIKLKNLATEDIKNIFSYYGKSRNTALEWKLSLDKMQEEIISNNLTNVTILGDFNFVTNLLDRNSNQLNTIDRTASTPWNDFIENCGLMDSYRITCPKRRIYTYKHTDNRSKSRLDRIYVDLEMSSKIEASNFEISCFSDHKILKTRVGNNVERGPGSWVFNNTLLRDDVFVTKLRTELTYSDSIRHTYDSKRDFWDYLQMNMQSVATIYSSEKAKKKRFEINNLHREVEYLENIPTNLLSDNNIQNLEELRKRLSVFEKEKIEGLKLRSKLPKHDFGEPKISYLSRLEKISGEKNTIYSLRDENNCLKEGTQNMLEIVHQFYKKLYTKEYEDVREQEKFLRGVTTKLSRENQEFMDRPLGEEEIYQALKDLQKNKSPGHSGITVECILFFWIELKRHYMDALNEIKRNKELSDLQKRGAIRISFKKGNRDDLKNYRPITLLNVDMKVISRALALRLSKVIGTIVDSCQKALPGRQISENIHVVQDLINLINKKNECAAFLFYDQEKAFDRMSHTFIIKSLQSFGFGDNFIDWVKILLFDIKSFVKVNGFVTAEFDIQRGVRQGCPLSALLYALTSEVLAIEIRKKRSIVGYKYNNQEFKLRQYADDLVTCVIEMSSIGEIFEIFKRYELATNARLNKSKTEALWVGSWRNRTDVPYGIKWKNDYVKFLGVYVGNMSTQTERELISSINFDEIGDKIDKKIIFWKKSGISLKGKIKIINTFILSKMFYRLECVNIMRQKVTIFERKLRSLIWEDRIACRVDYGVLTLSYDKGGLQLFDIETRYNVMRIKWLHKVTKFEVNGIERYIVDNLIGSFRGIIGLKILNHNVELSNFRNIDPFYRKAIKLWKQLGIQFQPASIRNIRYEIIYRNSLLTDNTNNTFPFFNMNNNHSLLPMCFRDLPVTHRLTAFSSNNRITISRLNMSYWNFISTFNSSQQFHCTENCYTYGTNEDIIDVGNITFKDLYMRMISAKSITRGWEAKWNTLLRFYTLDLDEDGWKSIWDNIHDNLIPYDIQSTIWSLIHLNFYCGYKEKLFGYGDGICKLCGQAEEGVHHIVINCVVLERSLINFYPYLIRLNESNICKDEIAFGLAGISTEELTNKDKLRNLITFVIRSVCFKNRYIDFRGVENAVMALNSKIKFKLRQILKDYWIYYKHNEAIHTFKEKYLIDSILGSILNGELCISI